MREQALFLYAAFVGSKGCQVAPRCHYLPEMLSRHVRDVQRLTDRVQSGYRVGIDRLWWPNGPYHSTSFLTAELL